MPASAVGASTLLGRDRELALIQSQLVAARTGHGGVLLFSGEPGSGKTSLLDWAKTAAPDFTVVGCRGVEWEAELPFSGLHELLVPVLGHVSAIPDPQRQALEAALGLASVDEVPASLHLYAGALSILVEAARDRPVLMVIDDLQWVDSATVQVLSFIARRVAGESLAVVAGSRPGAQLPGLLAPPIEIAQLNRSAVAELAARQLGRSLPDTAVTDLAAASGGNPLAVVESLGHFGEALWLRGSLLDEPLPVGALIERGFADRLATLGPEPRAALEVVAASVGDDAAMVAAAIGHAGLPVAALAEAEAAGAVEMTGARVSFRHPLLRALVHRQTSPDRLRACHRALAQAVDRESGLWAWHTASAATGADASVSAALEEAAERFLVRGGPLAAAQALVRSAALTPEPELRAKRLLSAGRAAHYSGRGAWAVGLFEEARGLTQDPVVAVRAEHFLVCIEAHLVGATDLPSRHLAVAAAARGIDDDLACEALASAGIESVISGDAAVLARAVEGLREMRTVEGLAPSAAEEVEATLGIMLTLAGESAEGARVLTASAERRLKARPDDQAHVIEGLIWIEELDLAERLCRRVMSLARHDGGPFTLTSAHWAEGLRRMRIGDWDQARVHLAAAIEVCEATEHVGQQGILRASLAVLDAGRGDFSLSAIAGIEDIALRHGFTGVAEYLGAAAGMLELGAGRGAAAAVHFERARDWKRSAGQIESCIGSWPADLVDAHLLAGERDRAIAALDELRAFAEGTGRRWALAAVARLEGELAPDDAFQACFVRALERYEVAQEPFGRARAQLGFGRRLRRDRRRVEARKHLEEALAGFDRLGAEPWAEQARRELGAGADALRVKPGADPDALTPQESQVAELVAGGSTNKEAAGALFLSPKTIESHLSRIYRKLGVTSRTQLAVKLSGASSNAKP